jgi:hypothetical protein
VKAAKAAGVRNVPPVALPTTITFRDLSDPMSVELVDPRNISTAYGEGYSLTKVTIELTDDPPTKGIVKLLPWLPNYYDKRLDGQRFGSINATNQTANSLASGVFSTEK